MKKIDFGGGEPEKYPDYEKCDLLRGDGIVYGGVDFNVDRLPFDDSEVEAAVCSHCLEHVENVKHFMNELHRVLNPGASIVFTVPYGLWSGSFKPVHKNQITECWFDFFRKSNSERVYGFKRWTIGKFDSKLTKEGEVYELVCVMSPVK